MTGIVAIALNTFREIIRDRILYGLLVFALLFIAFSLVLGQLSFAEQSRLSIDLGLAGLQLSAVILSIFVGSTLVSKEIEKRTVLTVLVRPISRTEFLIAKFFGMAMVLGAVILGLAVVLSFVFLQLHISIEEPFFAALFGMFLESLVLVALALLFGTFMRPFMTVSVSVGLFLIGHFLPDLAFFSEKSDSEGFRLFGKIISRVLPDLERFNWRAHVTYNEVLTGKILGFTAVYGLSWVIILLALGSFIFRRRDLV